MRMSINEEGFPERANYPAAISALNSTHITPSVQLISRT
jgi:hypothetical protein